MDSGLSEIEQLIAYAATLRGQPPSEVTKNRLSTYIASFNRAAGRSRDGLNIFTYYARVPKSHQTIRYRDVHHDHGAFDYAEIVESFVECTGRTNPGARLYIVTDMETRFGALPVDVTLVRLPLNAARLMYERVLAMTAYSRSDAFNANTAFLDTDALPIADLSGVFAEPFDIAITVRPSEGFYMPVNEGVIFAAPENRTSVQSFFDRYLSVYEAMQRDRRVIAYYGDIDRWRGGQLSLNAISGGQLSNGAISTGKSLPLRLLALPCDYANFCIDQDWTNDMKLWASKLILHFKGDSKTRMRDYMGHHRRTAPASTAPDAFA